MLCSACEFENPEGMKFCGQCGNALPTGCPSCGFANPDGFAFCGKCGADLNTAPPPAETSAPSPQERAAERRHITVLFCDLVDSTVLSGRLDPEDLRDVVMRYQQAAGEVVQKYEGHIAQYLGDGLLVYFGFPIAHENDARRAVLTGLEIVQSIQGINTEVEARWQTTLSVRVGIHTGAVVAGAVGTESHSEQLALGQTPNVAARLQGEAAPNQVVISSQTEELLQGFFETQSLGERSLKGVEEPMEIFAALAERDYETREQTSGPRHRLALVNREPELAMLSDTHARVQAGAGRTICITGEPGIGKSRLIEHFRETLGYTAPRWLNLRCSELHTNTPYKPVVDLLLRAYQVSVDLPAEDQLAQLKLGVEQSENISDGGGVRAHAVPLLAALLGLSTDLPLPAWSPHQIRQATLELLTDLLLGIASRVEPKVCLIEDLQWADPSTEELVAHLVEVVSTRKAMLMVTHRPDYHPTWSGEVNTLNVEALSNNHAHELVGALDANERLPDWARAEILRRTDGVPIFVEELTRVLLTKAATIDLERLIPETLRDSLAARLDQLGPAKEVVQLAAVLGRNFAYNQLQVLWGGQESALAKHLMLLLQEDLFVQSGATRAVRFRFRHALIQDAAYDSLLHSRRRELHKIVADDLIRGGEREPAVIGDHLVRAGEQDRATRYFHTAARAASKRSAVAEAANLYRRALEIVRDQSEDAASLGLEMQLEFGLGNVLAEQRGWAEADVGAAFQRSVDIARQLNDEDAQTRANINLRAHYTTSGRHELALTSAESLMANVPPDSVLRPTVHTEMALPLHHLGRLVESSEQMHAALAAADAPEFPKRSGALAQFWALAHGAENEFILGRWQEAEAMHQRMLALARSIGNPFLISWALGYGSRADVFLQSDLAETRANTIQSAEIAEEHGFELLRNWCEFELGWIDLELQDPHSALNKIEDAVQKIYATGAGYNIPLFELTRARAYNALGQYELAIGAIDFALNSIDDTQEKCHHAELLRVRGSTFLLQHNISAAIADFQEGLSIAKVQQAATWQLRNANALAVAAQHEAAIKPLAKEELTVAVAPFMSSSGHTDVVTARDHLALLG